MIRVSHLWSTVLIGALSVATAACSGTIENAEGDQDFDRLATSEDSLSRPVDASKELVITDFSVIESAEETTFDSAHPSGTTKQGAWTFGRLVHNMLPKGERDSAEAASRFVNAWFGHWNTIQAPNSDLSPSLPRTNVESRILGPWRVASGCEATNEACVLDMAKAPFRLVAITYRPDLRKLATDSSPGTGGEGRFVFNLLVDGKPVKQTVIFEYTLPIFTNMHVLTWAYRWHLLGSFPWGNAYNALLRSITNGFSGPDADPRRPNGNAISQVRTNELALKHFAGAPSAFPTQKLWELREFHLTTDGLVQAPMAQEPSRDFDVAVRKDGPTIIGKGNRSADLAAWMLANQATILAGKNPLPDSWLANSSYVGSGVPAWGGTTGFPGVPENVRAAFALNTCAGCHRHEANPATGATATPTFLHITDPRAFDPAEANDAAAIAAAAGSRATVMSDFLAKEIAVGGPRYNDLTNLLRVKPWDLKGFAGLKVCAGHDS